MQNGKSYIKDSGHSLEMIKNIHTIPENAILFTGLYPHAGLNALKEVLDDRSVKYFPTENLIKMAEFVLRNNYFEINNKIFR